MSIALWVFRLSGHYKNIYSYRLKKTRWYFYVPDLRQIKSSVRPSVHPSVRPSVCLSVPLLSRWYLQKYKRYQLDAKVQLRALFTFFDITLALSQIIKTFESMFDFNSSDKSVRNWSATFESHHTVMTVLCWLVYYTDVCSGKATQGCLIECTCNFSADNGTLKFKKSLFYCYMCISFFKCNCCFS